MIVLEQVQSFEMPGWEEVAESVSLCIAGPGSPVR